LLTPFLATAFDEIEKHWGSVDIYLAPEIGLDSKGGRRLRRIYLQ
jgi:protein tyrosine/serine phosphatase